MRTNGFLRRMLCFLLALTLCAGVLPLSYAEEADGTDSDGSEAALSEKEQLQLYMRNGESGSFSANWEFRQDQGLPAACFSTSTDGEPIPIAQIKPDGVAYFMNPEEYTTEYTAWMTFISAGEAKVIYETDTAVYTLTMTITGSASTSGDGNASGDGNMSACSTPDEPHIFTTFWDGTGHNHSYEISLDNGYPSYFYFLNEAGEVTALTYSDLTASNVVRLYDSGTTITVSVDALGTGSVDYKNGETTYSLPVTGVLPALGFYTEPTRSEEYFTSGFEGSVGDTTTLYLMWPENWNEPQNVTAVLNEWSSTETLELTVDEKGSNYWKISFVNPDASCVVVYFINESGNVQDNIWLWPRDYGNGDGGYGDDGFPGSKVTVEYDGQEITVGMAWQMYYGEEMITLINGGFGASYIQDKLVAMDIPVYFGALVNYGDTDNEAPAPESFYREVMDSVKFEIVVSSNTDGTDNATPNLSMTELGKVTYAGTNTVGVHFHADEGRFFAGRVSMSFEYGGETYTVYNYINYELDYSRLTVSVSEKDDLNAILASGDALMAWIQRNYPEAYEKYTGTNPITVELPAKVYDEVIYATPSFQSDSIYDFSTAATVRIVGTEDETTGLRTTMPGMVVGGNVWAVGNIDFVADPEQAVTYGDETFTCGILADSNAAVGTRKGNTTADVADIFNCTFYGFDYGVRSTPTGYAGGLLNCSFINCKKGVYVDGGVGGRFSTYRWLEFINNEVAVTVLQLPPETTIYQFRIVESSFIHNGHDFHVPIRGKFYFYRNWFGHFPNMPRTTVYDTSLAVSRSAQILDAEGSSIITNPRLVNLDDNEILGIDNTLACMILNAEADSLLVAGQELEKLIGSTDISVLNGGEEEIGVWTFDGGE